MVVIDPRGTGRTDTPVSPVSPSDRELMDDAWAVMDEVGADLAAVLSGGDLVVIERAATCHRLGTR